MKLLTRPGGVPGWALSVLFMTALAVGSPAIAQSLSISSGARISLGNGSIDAGCGDLLISGVLAVNAGTASGLRDVSINSGRVNGGSGLISLAGDWNNQGTFNAQGGEVDIVDGCGRATSALAGNSDFARFSALSSTGKTLRVDAGSTQSFSRRLTLEGTDGDLLRVRSSVADSSARFVLASGAAQSIAFVNVRDNDASAGAVIAPGPAASFDSVRGVNVINWFVQAVDVIQVNTLPGPALVLLALLLALAARTKYIRDERGHQA